MTHETISLAGEWNLAMTDDYPQFLTAPTIPGRLNFAANVPGGVHETLMTHGLLDDPRTGLNSFKARWVEEQWWCYRKTFVVPDSLTPATPATLVFDKMEMIAVVYLNGVEIGRHANAHRPARFDVTGKLRSGENHIAVLLESGVFDAADKPGAEYRPSPLSLLTKRHWHRKGQWQGGWDWQSRLQNVGIFGDVRIEYGDAPRATQVKVVASLSDDLQTGTVTATFYAHNPGQETVEADLYMRVILPGEEPHGPGHTVSAVLPPGDSEQAIIVSVANPRLWYPIGHGEAYRYPVITCLARHENSEAQTHHVGFRKIEVDQSSHPEKGFYFTLRINDRPVFCKGGNWVPADMLYASVTPERYRELVDLAVDANFNMLRVWGGGVYADPALLECCDRKGMLIWHDLLFACSKYPGDDPAFVVEVETEVTWAMREMAHHPSLVVWCGNNEIEEGDWHWGWQKSKRLSPHYALFHKELPRIAAAEAAHVFYWISSPFSPDRTVSPREPSQGDQHPWIVSLGASGGADWWTYRTHTDRFPNEGGVLGCSTPATLRDFLPENQRHLLSPSWEHHDNPFAINDSAPGTLGHAYQTVRLWTGLDPLTLDYERYAFVSGLLQAEGIVEYITNYRRRMWDSSAAIFWMFNDSWPATHGWTIVDYYRRKRLAFHPVRRAFAPVSVIVAAQENGQLSAYGVNDTAADFVGSILLASCNPDGTEHVEIARKPLTIPANSKTLIENYGVTPRPGQLYFGVLYDESGTVVAQHRALFARFHELDMVREPGIEMTVYDGILTLRSDVFCWGVCLDADGDAAVSDNCFDLLPGVPYRMVWDEIELGEPRIVRLGNRDALR
ncbi:MAG: hypothetical protein H8F28_15785 [Fibrella sp.]|nr:hypothetical protein [Armatimonadota bacterium]